MKQQTQKNKIEQSGDFTSQTFRFDNNPHMFQLVISKLYSDELKAIVRELSCNAYDSHVAAGHATKPFDIKIPNSLDHTFYIRDYGTGLTPDQIMNIYTVVGRSDKIHTNEYVGAFGVGSKSPFAYTQQFSVESVVDGMKWIYTAFMNENNIPEIADLSNGGFPTDEANGVKISFDVDRNDWRHFMNVCQSVFTYFDTKPNFLGGDFSFPERSASHKGEGWSLNGHNMHSSVAVMGNVAYSIDMSKFPKWQEVQPVRMDFAIGELTPAASREHLQYDDLTIANISAKFEEIHQDLMDIVKKEFEELNTPFEARAFWSKHKRASNSLPSFLNNCYKECAASLELDGKTYDLANSFKTRELFNSLTEKKFKLYALNNGSQKTISKKIDDWYTQISVVQHAWGAEPREPYFILRDETYCKLSKSKYFSLKNSEVSCYFFDTDQHKEIKKILLDLGVTQDRIKLVSKLEKAPRKTRAESKAKSLLEKRQKYIWKSRNFSSKYNYYYNISEIWDRSYDITEESLTKPGVYVVRNSYRWGFSEDSNMGYDIFFMKRFVKQLTKLGNFDMPNVYSVPPSQLDLIPDHWVKLSDFAVSMHDWILSAAKSGIDMIGAWPRMQTTGTGLDLLLEAKSYHEDIEDENLRKWCENLSEINEISTAYEGFQDFSRDLKLRKLIGELKTDAADLVKEFDTFATNFRQKYPLVRYLGRNVEAQDREHLILYLNTVHNKQEKKENK